VREKSVSCEKSVSFSNYCLGKKNLVFFLFCLTIRSKIISLKGAAKDAQNNIHKLQGKQKN
jgi:hypothetical protein